ncbi:uncharacterized protein LOC116412821 [Galleria mellonella]|uniref:Uncharacterized protein LOC116412821 n=1 Tax=Galleria mellonella TaxID=7137 RepID=A0ABM3MJ68_GALME|nr:uncharacterized protein LOC116412821 [Galleria mellonella]
MSKCAKVKNPCKICLRSVTNKTGLQCKGACKKWAHYTCLNYTPGKIQDIKAGLIKVTCPCPNCNTLEPKDELTNTSYTCSNQKCPANQVPKCTVDNCPNKIKILSVKGKEPSDPTKVILCKPPPSSSPSPSSSSPLESPAHPVPPFEPCPTSLPCKPSPSPSATSPSPSSLSKSSPSCTPKQSSPIKSFKIIPKPANSKVPSGCKKFLNLENDYNFRVYSHNTRKTNLRPSSSDSNMSSKDYQRVLLHAIEQLCGTVGQLSNQIKDLICKILANLN